LGEQGLGHDRLDPDFLMWTRRRLVRVDRLPDERIVILFRFRQHEDRSYWLVLCHQSRRRSRRIGLSGCGDTTGPEVG
jgi:hypothetical protein